MRTRRQKECDSPMLFRFMNALHHHAFGAYWPMYRLYKSLGDRSRTRQLCSWLKANMTVLDIGANVGFYTCALSRMVGPLGRVHAFEPDPDNFARLRAATRRRCNVVLNNVAVAAASGALQLYRSGALNVDHRCFDSGDNRTTVEVRAVAIDDYLCGGMAVDCVKIDIQGFEPFALRGMRRTIARSPRVLLVGEVWPWGLRRAGSDVREYAAELRDMGFMSGLFDVDGLRSLEKESVNESFYTDIVATKGGSLP